MSKPIIPTIALISTEWGDFTAPADIPPMVEVRRQTAGCDCDCENCTAPRQYYQAHEPAPEHAEAFWAYVKAQGERLRDDLEPQTFTAWKASGLQVHARQNMQGAPA
jgi:hypothetical protein